MGNTPKRPAHSKRLRPIVAALSVLPLLALIACGGGKIEFEQGALDTPTTLVERLPITVGVHYDDELLNHYHREDWFGEIIEHEYYLGPPSVALFDPLFSGMFEKVVPVEDPSTPTVDGQNLSGVLSVTIKSFVAPNVREIAPNVFEDVVTHITYSMTLYAPPGAKKTVIIFDGKGAFRESESFLPEMAIPVARAMRNATTRLVVKFYEDQEVADWIASLRKSEHGAEETNQ